MKFMIGKALLWDELATEYDKCHAGRKARTLSMDSVFEWGKRKTDTFFVSPTEGTIHKFIADERGKE